MSQRPALALVAIVAAALLVRALALLATHPTMPAGDEYDFFVRSARLAVGDGLLADNIRAPGILVFYASVFSVFHPWMLLAKAANCVVGALTVVPIYFLGRAFAGVRAGLLAAAIAAVYPTFIAFSHYLWSETLYTFLVATGVALLVAALAATPRRRSLVWLVASGAVLGLSALSKESGVLFPLLAAGYLLWIGRSRLRPALLGSVLFLAAFGLTLLPWVVHVNQPDQPFALVTRTGYMNLYVGNHARSAGHGMQEYASLGSNHFEREAVARELALANIEARLPAWPFEKIATELPHFFTPNSFAVRRLLMPAGDPGHWGYRFRWDWLDRPVVRGIAAALVVASYIGVMLSGVAGLWLARRRELAGLLGLFLLSQIGPSIVTFAMSRFRLPSMAFLIVAAAVALVGRRPLWNDATPGRRWLAAVSCLLVLGLIGMGYESVLRSTGQ
jgi:4-amino-4-deoxy-L-arabinose transferase-like glycosyltransferase